MHILLHQHIGDGASKGIAMCQQGQWHDQLEYLGIAGVLFKFVVTINPPVKSYNLRFGAFQYKLCMDTPDRRR